MHIVLEIVKSVDDEVLGFVLWPLAAFSKRYAYPKLVGKMASGATATGSILDAKYTVRWAS